MSYNDIPKIIKDTQGFCVWKYETRDGDITKVPYNPATGYRAKVNKPRTFVTFAEAITALPQYDGIGIRVSGDVFAIDVDHCFNDDGELSPFARAIVNMFSGAYMEKSPSGHGLRIVCSAPSFSFDTKQYYINNRKIGLEVYIENATNHFVTLTGNVYRAGDVVDKTDALAGLLDTHMRRPVSTATRKTAHEAKSYLSDSSVITKASLSSNGEKFSALWNGDFSRYGSQSEADAALCAILAFWCGGDEEQMDRLFRESGLMRDKWDRQQSGSTYGAITIAKAVGITTSFYSPDGGKKDDAAEDFESAITLDEMSPVDNSRYDWNDIGMGNLFADYYKDIARYSPERKAWYIFDGTIWRHDPGNLATMELCKRLAEALVSYALSIKDERQRTDYIKFVSKLQIRRNRETVIKDAASVYPVMIADFDRDIYLVNCLNCTLDVRTRECHAHRSSDMLTKLLGVNYDPNAKCARWETFIDEVMTGDTAKAQFLQKALGLSLTGDTRFECLFILYGPTSRNGKGTIMETILKLMGDYGRTTKPETVALKHFNNSGNPSEDVARLSGARFVNISEPDKQLMLNAALVKSMTGRDSINARFLHENSFEFQPIFKLFINCNHLPNVSDMTLFTSDRVKTIPFLRHFGEDERDTGLKDLFMQPENLSAILNWCLDGYALLEATGLGVPESVRLATAEYAQTSDKISMFIMECMEEDKSAEERTANIYAQYKTWCIVNGYKAESARNFNLSLSRVALVERRRPRDGGSPTTMASGYKLRSDFID